MRKKGIGNKGFTISELVLVLVIVLVVGGLMMPFIQYNIRRMEKTMCANNLRQAGLALYIYAKEHEGRFPPALGTLYSEHYLADERLMDCPASREIGTPGSPDYIYTTGLSVRDPSLTILVRDKARNHPRGGKNILYVNGTVAWKEE
jgi:type II secretory pathway pseudopilin PulG